MAVMVWELRHRQAKGPGAVEAECFGVEARLPGSNIHTQHWANPVVILRMRGHARDTAQCRRSHRPLRAPTAIHEHSARCTQSTCVTSDGSRNAQAAPAARSRCVDAVPLTCKGTPPPGAFPECSLAHQPLAPLRDDASHKMPYSPPDAPQITVPSEHHVTHASGGAVASW